MSKSKLIVKQRATFFDLYKEFAKACDLHKGNLIESISQVKLDTIDKDANLIHEEVNQELLACLNQYTSAPTIENLADVADGIADSIYVLCALAYTLGIPLNECYSEVHINNMTKVGEDGKVTRRADGKILKPEGFVPVNLLEVLMTRQDKELMLAKQGGAENW